MNIEITGKYIPSTKSVEQLATEAATRATKKLMDKIYNRLEMELQDIFDLEARRFYDDYNPKFYDRRLSMFDALIIKKADGKDGIVGIEFDWDNDAMQYRNGYETSYGNLSLLELTFGEGYHGGAMGSAHYQRKSLNKNKEWVGDNNIHFLETPLWRTPYGKYYYWGEPAYKSDSPYDLFMNKSEKWWSTKAKKYIEPMFVKLFSEEFNR